MSAPTSNASLAGPVSPFNMELVRVLDPRFEGQRTMPLYLLTKEVRVADNEKRRTSSGAIPFKFKKIVCSPIVSHDDPNAIYEIISFTVMDPRFISSTVQVCFTLQEAIAFRSGMTSTETARSIVASGDKWIRLKCYIPNCIATSSKMEKIKAHFLNDHPGISFEVQKVKLYQFGGPEDPSVIRPNAVRSDHLPQSKPTITLTSTSTISNDGTPARSDAESTSSGLKRRRAAGVTDLQIPNKAPRINLGDSTTPRASTIAMAGSDATHLKSDFQSRSSTLNSIVGGVLHNRPTAQPVPAEDQELNCICMQPRDTRFVIECGNKDQCLLRYYHLECIGLTDDLMPSTDETWYCGRCIEQGIGRAILLQNPYVTAREVLRPQTIKAQVSRAQITSGKGKESAYPGGYLRNAKVPKPSPSIKFNPWSADLEKAFAKGSENRKDFDLGSLQQARATLRALANAPLDSRRSPHTDSEQGEDDHLGHLTTAAGILKTPNSRSWSDVEEQHLKEVVEECVANGLSGEPLWRAAHPKLLARGVNRPMGGMKMRWCRGLREETQIDERRKKNEKKMITALQGTKPNTTPKTGRFRSSEIEDDSNFETASSPIRNSTSENFVPILPSPRVAQSARVESFNSVATTVADTGVIANDNVDSGASTKCTSKSFDQAVRSRANSV